MAKREKKYRVYRDGPLTKPLTLERATMLCERFSKKSPHIEFTVAPA